MGDFLVCPGNNPEIKISNRVPEHKHDTKLDAYCHCLWTNLHLLCRKYGHNEIDEPMFTQPLMYKAIRQHKNAHQRYVEEMLADGSLDKAQVWTSMTAGGWG